MCEAVGLDVSGSVWIILVSLLYIVFLREAKHTACRYVFPILLEVKARIGSRNQPVSRWLLRESLVYSFPQHAMPASTSDLIDRFGEPANILRRNTSNADTAVLGCVH